MSGSGAHFSGQYENRLSPKGQVALPARLRQLLPEEARERGFVLLPGRERCLYLYADADFVDVMAKVREIAEGMEQEGGEFFRSFLESVTPVELDGQGRMVIPEGLRRGAGINGEAVVFVGMDTRIELWDPGERQSARMSAERFDARRQQMGNRIFGL